MTAPENLHIVTAPQLDVRLGRQVVHDPASRRFAFTAEPPVKRDIQLRVFGPAKRPDQVIGNCTGVDKCMQFNTVGNRVRGFVLRMVDAERIYSHATKLDPWPGSYPPEDTGSSGLAACQAAQFLGLADRYEWIFNGPTGVLAALGAGHPVGVGTWWYEESFLPDPTTGLISIGGRKAGGHQFSITGYRKRYNAFLGECWWGPDWGLKGRFLIRARDLDALLADDGDAHITYRKGQNA